MFHLISPKKHLLTLCPILTEKKVLSLTLAPMLSALLGRALAFEQLCRKVSTADFKREREKVWGRFKEQKESGKGKFNARNNRFFKITEKHEKKPIQV